MRDRSPRWDTRARSLAGSARHAGPSWCGNVSKGHYWSVSAFNICRFVGAPMVTTWALLFAPVPAASADPPDPTVSDGACPDVEVVFARGTGEPPGVGGIGEDFIDALRSKIGEKSMGVYGVDYPATTDFPTAMAGIYDAGTHVEQTAANCPQSKLVLGGFSQGAAVMALLPRRRFRMGRRWTRPGRCRPKSPTTWPPSHSSECSRLRSCTRSARRRSSSVRYMQKRPSSCAPRATPSVLAEAIGRRITGTPTTAWSSRPQCLPPVGSVKAVSATRHSARHRSDVVTGGTENCSIRNNAATWIVSHGEL